MVGQNIGKYRVADKVGRGGMGTVYRAVDETLQRDVAIKVLNAELDDPEVAKRFRAEAVTVARLTHPGIATIFELFEHEGRWLMVMEFVRGETLEHMVSRMGPLSAQRAAEFCMQALAALAHAHSMGVVHRDLKPANLMITENAAVKIMDFGIARVSGTEHLTNAGYMMGTPAYMAPEQVLSKEIDARADLYSMGVVFYRLVTARLPFDGDTAFALAQSQVNDPPTPVANVRPELPAWVGQVVDRAMTKAPDERFQSAVEFHEAFARCLAGLPMMATYASSAPTELMMTPPRAMPTGTIQAPPLPPAPAPTSATAPTPVMTPALVPATTPDASPPQVPTTMSATPGHTPVAAAPGDETSMAPTPVGIQVPGPTPATVVARGPSKAMLIGIAGGALAVVGLAGFWLWPSDPSIPPPPAADLASSMAVPRADIELPDETGVEAETEAGLGTGVISVAAPEPPPRPASATPTASPAIDPPPDPVVEAPAAAAEPAAVVPAETPVFFGDVRYLAVTGKDSDYIDAVLRFAGGTMVVEPSSGGDSLAALTYGSLTSATYAHSRDPKWHAEGVSPPQDLDTPGTVFRRPGHWLVLQTADAYAILRLEDNNWNRVVETIEERAGVAVDRPEGGSRDATIQQGESGERPLSS